MKALALISGGLDSLLAARLIKEQGIEVRGLHFRIPFHPVGKKPLPPSGLEIEEVDIAQEFLGLLKNPRYGFGSQLNPCIDCKIFMLKKAKELMPQQEAAFIVTGEVLGQRPMSQHRQALELIVHRAGLEGLVVRPLCARRLPETIPEKNGWLARDRLLDFSGRTRKPQLALASRLGLKSYQQPAGGCLLTDPGFALRLKDLLGHDGLSLEEVELLKLGRHFRLSPAAKLIVGRDEKEDSRLKTLARPGQHLFFSWGIPGPTSLGTGDFNQGLIALAAGITCRYADLNGSVAGKVSYYQLPAQRRKIITARPLADAEIARLKI